MRLNFKHKVISEDITKQTVLDQDKSDVMAFTYPCKKYSPIADIHGTRTGDELYLHALRHIALAQPEAYVIENVPGMRKFPVVMEAMSKLPDYYITVFCPVDSSIWLPQKRARLILIGTRKQFTVTAPIGHKPITLKDIIEAHPVLDIPECVYSRMNGKYRDLPIISDPAKGDIAPTCVAHYAKDRGTRLLKDDRFPMGVRPYTVKEFARLQGFPDWFQFAGTINQQYTQIGNAVSVPLGEWIGGELLKYFNK